MTQATLILAIFLLMTSVAFAAAPRSIGVFGRWSAWIYADRGRDHCFIYSIPFEMKPSTLNHGLVTFFVRTTTRKKAPTETSIEAGYEFAPGSSVRAAIDGKAFSMVPSKTNAWLLGGARQEKEFLRALQRGREMTVDAVSARGNPTRYRFSLAGLTQAMQRAKRACPL